jgi:hypothetical protein
MDQEVRQLFCIRETSPSSTPTPKPTSVQVEQRYPKHDEGETTPSPTAFPQEGFLV